MKRLIPIMIILCIGLAGFVVYYRMYSDRTGPEIYFDKSKQFSYYEGMSNAQLLEGVTALDAKDGDVTDSLEIEAVYESNDNEYVITYAAKDRSMNITKARRMVSASSERTVEGNPEEETVENTDDLPEEQSQTGADVSTDNPEQAAKETASEPVSNAAEENEKVKAEQEAAADAMDPACPRIYLTEYVVEVPTGTTVDRLSYVRDITDDADNVYDLWHKISIVGELDTSVAGTYENTYFVTDSQKNTSNLATIRFIVK